MAYNTLAQVVARFRKDMRNVIDSDTAVEWANDVQEDVFTLDVTLFEKRADYATTDDTYSYTIADIANDIRKIKEVFLDLNSVTDPYDQDYQAKRHHRYKFFDFDCNGDTVYLRHNPAGNELTFVYYRTPVAMTTISSAIDFPVRWHRVLYLGMMAMAAENQYKTPSGDWYQIYEAYKQKIETNENVQNTGAVTIEPYSLM